MGKLFEVYDTGKSGKLDYNEFAAILFKRERTATAKQPEGQTNS